MKNKTRSTVRTVLVYLITLIQCLHASEGGNTCSLDGQWRYQLDRENAGIKERWFARLLPEKLTLPGSLPAQGIGDEVTNSTKWTGKVDTAWFKKPEYEKYQKPGNIKIPFFLQPDKYYVGVAWYQRDIEIPANWKGRRVALSLERPHWETHVWVDQKEIGINNGLSTPHEYELGALPPGRHQLTIRVENSVLVDVGIDAHSITDQTQGNWNGIVGRMELTCTQPAWIENLQAYPRVATKSVTVKGHIGGMDKLYEVYGKAADSAPSRPRKVRLTAKLYNFQKPAGQTGGEQVVTADVKLDGTFEAEYPLGPAAALWDEFSPALYRLTATLDNGETRTTAFGLREIGLDGARFMINGRKVFFRGTHEGCEFPLTGHPPMDVEPWKRLIGIAKSYGINQFRFHSWCPPEAAFVAADELGFYCQVECNIWTCFPVTIGDGRNVDTWLYAETDRILKVFGNHPSMVMMVSGNEPQGERQWEFLDKWVAYCKAKDPRRLYSSASGHPMTLEDQFHVSHIPRIQHWRQIGRADKLPPETRTDYQDFIAKRTAPVVSHEVGQWCAYPDYTQASKFTGYLKPKYYDIWRDSLDDHHMGGQAHDFLMASGSLQVALYKEDIEAALRTHGMGGFELLDLRDYPGQGLAPVGVLNVFGESKGYVDPAGFTQFCNQTVPLARMSKRVFRTDEKLEADLEVANFGAAPLENIATDWSLVGDNGTIVAKGEFPGRSIAVDNGIALGKVSVDLKDVPAPASYKLKVSLKNTPFHNEWNLWVYPDKVGIHVPGGVTVVRALDEKARAALNAGGKVMLFIPPDQAKGDSRSDSSLTFTTVFWSSFWGKERNPNHTMGILCDPKHPAFAKFPTENHSDWQWWYLVTRAGAMVLDDMPAGLRPVVQVIDNWVDNRKLGIAFEGKVGKGKLLVCSIDLTCDNPVSRQFLASLYSYVSGTEFNPEVELTIPQIQALTSQSESRKKQPTSSELLNPFEM